jgi:hypothetical protein
VIDENGVSELALAAHLSNSIATNVKLYFKIRQALARKIYLMSSHQNLFG